MLLTTIAGSLPKPCWLAEPERLWAPWRLGPDALAEGQRDAVLAALKLQEAAGIDIVTDGEQSRQHFVHGFLGGLEGIDFGKRVTMGIRADRYKAEVPTVTGPLHRPAPVHLGEVRWARAHTDRRLKFTLPGPMTIVDTLADEHYRDRRRLAMEFARLLNEEARDLAAAGVDVRQYEKIFPLLAESRLDQVSLECANSRVPLELLGLLRGKDVLVGCIDVATHAVEAPELVAATIRRALAWVPPERLYPCTNCGMVPLPREVARGKLRPLGAGARVVRRELGLAVELG